MNSKKKVVGLVVSMLATLAILGTGFGVAITTMNPDSNVTSNIGEVDVELGDQVQNFYDVDPAHPEYSKIFGKVFPDNDYCEDGVGIRITDGYNYSSTEKDTPVQNPGQNLNQKSIAYNFKINHISNIGEMTAAEPDQISYREFKDGYVIPSFDAPTFNVGFLPKDLIIKASFSVYKDNNVDLSELLQISQASVVEKNGRYITQQTPLTFSDDFTNMENKKVSNTVEFHANRELSYDALDTLGNITNTHTIISADALDASNPNSFSTLEKDCLNSYKKKQFFNVTDKVGKMNVFMGLIQVEPVTDNDKLIQLHQFLNGTIKTSNNDHPYQIVVKIESIHLQFYYGGVRPSGAAATETYNTIDDFRKASKTFTSQIYPKYIPDPNF